MEPTIFTSLIGIAFFTILMSLGFRLTSGKWNFAESKRAEYENWVERYGKKIKRTLIFFCVLYYAGMLLQLSSLL